jgi:hypothetical protein
MLHILYSSLVTPTGKQIAKSRLPPGDYGVFRMAELYHKKPA